MEINAEFYMSLALQEAWKYQVLTYPNPAVGCCIVGEHGEILAVEAHRKAGGPHAEVNALQKAYYVLTQDDSVLLLKSSSDIHTFLLKHHNNIFQKTKLYSTLEPCSHIGKTPSCANLIAQLGIGEIYIGSLDMHAKASLGRTILQRHGCYVVHNVMQEACDALLFPFIKTLQNRFVFFKWAQRLNGTTDEGIISSQKSRTHVHALRDVCDLLVIGGGTVRQDRPTLDARFVNGKAPDILIYSRKSDFDMTIPLFHVKGRKVYIESNLERMRFYKNIMIEGSAKMYTQTQEVIDYLLCYIAPSVGGKQGILFEEEKFSFLNVNKESEDIIVWMKKRI